MKLAVFGTKVSCISGNNLAAELGCEFFNAHKTNQRDFSAYDFLFNYGATNPIIHNNIFNHAKSIHIAVDKIRTFNALAKQNICVPFTEDITVALGWIDQGKSVVCRALTQGSNGKGITYTRNKKTLKHTPAKFWTQYIWHTHEIRVHIWQGKVISVYNKVAKDLGNGEFQWDFQPFPGVEDNLQLVAMAEKIYQGLDIDWCGADILRTENGNLHLLEVNSAPRLLDETAATLAKLIKKACKTKKHLN